MQNKNNKIIKIVIITVFIMCIFTISCYASGGYLEGLQKIQDENKPDTVTYSIINTFKAVTDGINAFFGFTHGMPAAMYVVSYALQLLLTLNGIFIVLDIVRDVL